MEGGLVDCKCTHLCKKSCKDEFGRYRGIEKKTNKIQNSMFSLKSLLHLSSSSFEVLEVLAMAPASVVTWSAGITDTLALSFEVFQVEV